MEELMKFWTVTVGVRIVDIPLSIDVKDKRKSRKPVTVHAEKCRALSLLLAGNDTVPTFMCRGESKRALPNAISCIVYILTR